MVISSNMTNAEIFKATGTLPADRIEAMLDAELTAVSPGDISGTITDAIAQYPDEGFLTEISNRVAEVASRVRGRNRDDLLAICEALGDIEMTTYYAAEYGISELRGLIE